VLVSSNEGLYAPNKKMCTRRQLGIHVEQKAVYNRSEWNFYISFSTRVIPVEKVKKEEKKEKHFFKQKKIQVKFCTRVKFIKTKLNDQNSALSGYNRSFQECNNEDLVRLVVIYRKLWP
jgi:hypothetical protein